MARARWRGLSIGVVICALAALCATAYGAKSVPPEVQKAVAEAFPNATVLSVEQESENGVRFYELNLDYMGMELEVEVDKYGGIGEIERPISLEEAPAELVEALLQIAESSRKDIEIERHERWGVAREGRFVQLDEPQIFYEIELEMQGKEREVKWKPVQPLDLPEPVTKAVKGLFPKAVITGANKEQISGVGCFKLSLILYGADLETRVAADGTVIEIDTPASMKSLPRPVAQTVKRLAKGKRVRKIQRAEIRTAAQANRLVPLEKPSVFFVAKLEKGDKTTEIKVAADGTLVENVVDDSRKRAIDKDAKADDQGEHF